LGVIVPGGAEGGKGDEMKPELQDEEQTGDPLTPA